MALSCRAERRHQTDALTAPRCQHDVAALRILSGEFVETLRDPRLEIVGGEKWRIVRFGSCQHLVGCGAGLEAGVQVDQGG
jgi:hypothetical protein